MDVDELDPVIHQRTRLLILSYLYRNGQAAFTRVRDELDLTGGNLSSHGAKLEEAGLMESRDALSGTDVETRLRITPEGRDAFEEYVDHLRTVLEGAGFDIPSPDGGDLDG